MAGCGGGVGGGDSGAGGGAPRITASVATFQALNIPAPGLAQNGNTLVVVSVTDAAGTAAIGTATVSANGRALAYAPDLQVYRGWLVATTGDRLSLSVNANGTTHEVTGDLVASHPQIISPPPVDPFPTNGLPMAEVAVARDAWVTWEGDLPDANHRYAVAVLDERGELSWPSRATFEYVSTAAGREQAIPAGRIPGNFPFIATGITRSQAIGTAAPGSTLTLGAFSMSMVFAPSTQASTLRSIELLPKHVTLARGRSLQLAARGERIDSSERRSLEDISGQVVWTSSAPTVVSVGPRGLATGGDVGSAIITARLGSVSVTTAVMVREQGAAPLAGTASAYQINATHSGSTTLDGMTLPTAAVWTASFGGPLSFPLIAQNRVFVIAGEGGEAVSASSSSMYAHDATTGARLWGPVELARPQRWAAFTLDQGRIVTINGRCLLRGHDAADGGVLWSVDLPQIFSRLWSCQSSPTAYRGIVYVTGGGVDATIVAVDMATGLVLWSARGTGTSNTSPAVNDDGVYVTFLQQAYRFDPVTGALRWHYSGPGSGGGARTPALDAGRLYMRSPAGTGDLSFDSASGTVLGSFESQRIPALADGRRFTLQDGRLSAKDSNAGSSLWNNNGDGTLVSAPLVVNNVVFVGSSTGVVFGFDTVTGQRVWQAQAGPSLQSPDESNVAVPLTGLTVGAGLLLVPADNMLSAYRLANP